MKVLIVDDEILVRKGIVMSIDWKEIGFSGIFECSNGEEAIKIVESEVPDLILTDIKMPKVDGLELIEIVSKRFPNIVIIVLSCINDSDYVRRALKYNKAIDYIPKLSMSRDEIIEVVERAKNFITEANISDSRRIFVNNELIEDIQKAIEDEQIDVVVGILKKCFENVDKSISCFNLKGWSDLLFVFTNYYKNLGGNIDEIKIGDFTYYDYFYSSRNVEILEKRFVDFVEIYFKYLAEFECKGINEELRKAVNYIRTNFKQDIKLSEVANEVGLNETYFSRIFKKQFEVNYSDYLNNLKLNKSKELLVNTNLSIYEISVEVGYNSESYFSRIFKLKYNITPNEYRKNHNSSKLYRNI